LKTGVEERQRDILSVKCHINAQVQFAFSPKLPGKLISITSMRYVTQKKKI